MKPVSTWDLAGLKFGMTPISTKRDGKYLAQIDSAEQWCPAGAAYPIGPCPGVSVGNNVSDTVTLSDTDLNSRASARINPFVQGLTHHIKPGF